MDLQQLLNDRNGAGIYKEVTSKKPKFKVDKETMAQQYDVTKHAVFDGAIRKKKEVFRPVLNNQGQPTKGTDGKEIVRREFEDPTRIGIPFQEIIVSRAVGFMNTTDVELSPIYINEEKEKPVLQMTGQIWRANKLDYKNVDICTKLFSECEVAELWYLVEDKNEFWDRVKSLLSLKNTSKFQMKIKILAESNGDKMYPYFDNYGDMIAFGREYSIIDADGKSVQRFDLYTDLFIYKFLHTNGTWNLIDNRATPNPFKKIPIIYYRQETPEWYRVQSMIEQLESRISNTGDANDYYAYPMLFIKGVIQGLSNKDERAKVLQGDENTDAKHLTWAEAAESLKLEVETLRQFIYSMTQTPNISFEEMKSLGDVSGIALKLMFLDAHMKANTKKGIIGEGLQRRLNLIKHTIGTVLNVALSSDAAMLEIEPVFKPFLPSNEKEDIENLAVSVQSGIMSKETAIEKHPLIENVEQELGRLSEDKTRDLSEQFI